MISDDTGENRGASGSNKPGFFEKIARLLGFRFRQRDLVREMEELIEEGSAEGVINSDEGEMLLSVLEFKRTIVREVMVPRTEIAAVELDAPLRELIDKMVDEGHSRIPIFKDSVDHIQGVVHARDLLPYWSEHQSPLPITELLREAYFVPETMFVEKLLAEMRRKKTHIAIAVDEYGGVSGIITLEDVIEEIIGEIHDEYDDEELLLKKTSEGFEVEGRCSIELLEQELGRKIGIDGDFETIGGLVVNLAGRIPRVGESFSADKILFRIRDVDNRRVKSIAIVTATPADKGERE